MAQQVKNLPAMLVTWQGGVNGNGMKMDFMEFFKIFFILSFLFCSIPGLGRSPREGKSYPLQYFGLENPMDCIVHRVTELDMTERLNTKIN